MAIFRVRGKVEEFGPNQYNIRVENEEELRQFWREQRIDTNLDWAGNSVLVTISAQEFVASCNPGDFVEYEIETWDRNDGRRIRGISPPTIINRPS